METTTLPATIIPVDEIKSIVTNAPEVLENNQLIVSKAVSACEKLIEGITANGMSAEYDELCNTALVRLRERKEEITNERKPLTQMFDKIRDVFTDLEGKLDPKKPTSVYARIQKIRDDWATQQRNEQREKELALQRKQAKDKEAIDIKAAIEIQLRGCMLDHLNARRSILLELFNGMTLETYEESVKSIKDFDKVLPYEVLKVYRVNKSYHTEEDLVGFVGQKKSELYEELKGMFTMAIEKTKSELLDKVTGKKTELEAIANANKEQAALLEKQKAAREKADKDRIEQEALKEKEDATNMVESGKQIDLAQTLFDNEIAKAEILPDSTARVREGYTITVLKPQGYLNIVNTFFNHKGNKMGVEELEKKTLLQMKKFCEDLAHKGGEKMISQFLTYSESFKTVAKK